MTLISDEQIIHSSEQGLVARHLILRGTNREIGRRLGEVALERYGERALFTPGDSLRVSAQASYMRAQYPEHYERMAGVSDVFGRQPEQSGVDYSALLYGMPAFGCSCVYLPPDRMQSGAAMLSRNFDFALTASAEPYIIEVYPDTGYSSLYMCSFDLLGGVLDGINSEGLCVAILADDESPLRSAVEPTGGCHVGLHELQMMRYVLDRCATAEEAKRSLLSLKQHYAFMPLHYLIGDRHGQSFVWENSVTTNRHYIVEGRNHPQAVTNFLLHRYEDNMPLPADADPQSMYRRYERLSSRLDQLEAGQIGRGSSSLCTPDYLKDMLGSVQFNSAAYYPYRTLWHSQYDTRSRSLEISFYDREDGGSCRRTPYMTFGLK